MPYSLKDQIVVITGGAGGLGRFITRAFLEAEARVVVADVKLEAMEKLQEEHSFNERLFCVQTDLLDEKSVETLLQGVVGKHGRIDVLVAAAGGFTMAPIEDTSLKDWDFMMNLNLKSLFLAVKYALPVMKRQKYGRVVSVAARPALEGAGGMAAYSASKAGVLNFTKSLAQEGLEFNITANSILPSIIDTPTNREAMPGSDFSKWVAPEKLARTILFLVSEDSVATSGAAVPVYGGS